MNTLQEQAQAAIAKLNSLLGEDYATVEVEFGKHTGDGRQITTAFRVYHGTAGYSVYHSSLDEAIESLATKSRKELDESIKTKREELERLEKRQAELLKTL